MLIDHVFVLMLENRSFDHIDIPPVLSGAPEEALIGFLEVDVKVTAN